MMPTALASRARHVERPRRIVKYAPLRWINPGELIEVAGYEIRCGLFYISEGPSDEGEASAINPHLPVSDPAGSVDRLPFHTFYESLTPAQRGAYLGWLAAGRKGGKPESFDPGHL